MNKHLRNILMIGVCVMLPALASTGCTASADSSLLKVQVGQPAVRALSAEVGLAGVLIPNETANIGSRVGGKVGTIACEVGDEVVAGTILISMDTTDLEIQLRQAEAALEGANNSVKQAKSGVSAAKKAVSAAQQAGSAKIKQAKLTYQSAQKGYNAIKEAYKMGLKTAEDVAKAKADVNIAKSQYDLVRGIGTSGDTNAAKSKYDQAVIQYDTSKEMTVPQAEAAVDAVKAQIDNADISSPINGTIVNLNINTGEVASPSAPLLTIADLSKLKMKGTVPQEVLPYLSKGQMIVISADIYATEVYSGVVTSIGPIAAGTGNMFPVEIMFANPGKLTAGLSAHANIKIDAPDKLVIPKSAVLKNDGTDSVFVISDGVAHKTNVLLGLSNDDEVEILNGLTDADQIAISNVNNLFDGMAVETE